MDYIKISDWEKFQHYKHRNPPWIKLYSYLLDNDEFDCMQDASKLLYFCLLLFASRKENKIKQDFKWLQKKLPIENQITQDTMQPLIDNGFIVCYQDASKSQAGRTQDACSEKSRVEKSRDREETDSFFVFENSYNSYLGNKRLVVTEFESWQKANLEWKDDVRLLLPAIQKQIAWRKTEAWRPAWKSFKNWLADREWEVTLTVSEESSEKACVDCGAAYESGHRFTNDKQTGKQLFRCTICAEKRKKQ